MPEFFWVLAVVTAMSVERLEARSIGYFESVEDCHKTATKVFWENLPENVEAVCIRVEMMGAGR